MHLCSTRLQLQFVGNFRCDVFKPDWRSRDTLEPYAIQRQPRQLADLHLPLNDGVAGTRVAGVRAQQKESFTLLVIAVIVV